MSKSLYSGVNKVYFRSYLLLNIVASSAYMLQNISILKIKFSAKGDEIEQGENATKHLRKKEGG